MTSVVVADDSLFIRKKISMILESDTRIKVIGTAKNGLEAIEKVKNLKPDVLTLDVEMPIMNGLEALELVVKNYDVPVVMLSALTTKGAEVTMRALEIGAIDFIAKPRMGDKRANLAFEKDLIYKIKAAYLSGRKRLRGNSSLKNKKITLLNKSRSMGVRKFVDPRNCAVGLGISTGGPKTLLEVIPKMPKNFPSPVFVAQHMPEGFTSSLASRLNSKSQIKVKEAQNGEIVKSGVCYIAPGGRHMKVMHMSLSKGVMIRITDKPESALYKPSVDVLLSSVARVYGKNAIGVVMTGMGKDGTRGMKILKEQGGVSITEDKSTCIVYGMPKSIEDKGLSDYIVPSFEISKTLVSILKI